MPEAQNNHIKPAPVADHRMCDQLNKHNLAYRFMDHIWQLANTLVPVYRSQWQLLLRRFDFRIYALLLEASFGLCAPRMRYETSKQAQYNLRSFPSMSMAVNGPIVS